MGAEVVAALILQYGLPFTEKMIEYWTNKTQVGMNEWKTLMSLVQTPEAALAKVTEILGTTADDPKIKMIAALIAPHANA